MSFFEPKITKNQGFSHQNHYYENGSAIIWIFLMIGIFAALGYAISQGSRSGESQLSDKQAELAATELLDYARLVKDSVRQLQINGCDNSELSFKNNVQTHILDNAYAPPDKSCHIYDPNGGGLSFIQRSDNVNDTTISNSQAIGFFLNSFVDVGSADPDLYFFTRPINYKVCAFINKKLGYDFDETTIPQANLSDNSYTGDIPPATYDIYGDDPLEDGIQGAREGCFVDNGCPESADNICYSYIKILIEM